LTDFQRLLALDEKNPQYTHYTLRNKDLNIYTATGGDRVKVTVDPLRVVQIVSESLPTFSVVVPPVVVDADPGNVTGICVPQVFPFALRVTLVIVFPSAEYWYERFGAQALGYE
jgi:hypothetical protein